MRAVLLVPFVFGVCGSLAAQGDAPAFATGTLAEIRQRAKADGRPLVIDFSLDAIEPCRRLLQTTWRDDELKQWLAKNATAARIDPERDAVAAKEFALVAYPTIVMLGKDGAEVGRIVGYVEAAALRERLAKLVHVYSTDYKERTRLADELAAKGDLDGALEHYLWLWDHGVEHNQGFGGVRATFFLNKLVAFAKRHPPAKQALEQRRDALQQRALAGDVRYEVVADLVALATALETTPMLVDVLEAVPAAKWQREAVAHRVLTQAAVEPLVKQGKYAQAMSLVGDPVTLLAKETENLHVLGPGRVSQELVKLVVTRQAALLEACFGAKDARTEQFVARLFELDGGTTTWMLVLRAAKRAGNDVACHDYAVRALQELPESEHETVRSFLKKK